MRILLTIASSLTDAMAMWAVNYWTTLHEEDLQILYACHKGWAKRGRRSEYTLDDMKAVLSAFHRWPDSQIQSHELKPLIETFQDRSSLDQEFPHLAHDAEQAMSKDDWNEYVKQICRTALIPPPSLVCCLRFAKQKYTYCFLERRLRKGEAESKQKPCYHHQAKAWRYQNHLHLLSRQPRHPVAKLTPMRVSAIGQSGKRLLAMALALVIRFGLKKSTGRGLLRPTEKAEILLSDDTRHPHHR